MYRLKRAVYDDLVNRRTKEIEMAKVNPAGFRSKGLRDLFLLAQAAGWRVQKGGSHVLVFPANGSRPIALSTTAFDGKVVDIAASQLRRAGLDVPR